MHYFPIIIIKIVDITKEEVLLYDPITRQNM